MKTGYAKWNALPDEDIQKYLKTYGSSQAKGKCSSRRRKKLKHLENVVKQRQKAECLLSGVPYYSR